eukprot:TRINITY_DN10080_c0_g1_i1.p2 TRINITY_DN10080_c0_g1~~TRINITY_DN10080_c0_g1_i1.p2  ORF type:complete len:124 (+),score=16.37 TRINITY_DN10080_c0_g1_i1:70-441(+)
MALGRPRDFSLMSPAMPAGTSEQSPHGDKEVIATLQEMIRVRDAKIDDQAREIERLNNLLEEMHPPVRPSLGSGTSLSPPPPSLSNLRDGLKSALQRIQHDVDVIDQDTRAFRRGQSLTNNQR